ncbi:carboxypeptidase-like regulatory domain-containing protein [Neolewinella persica]|uniref:carboxypeptidase-like regulatory domain-containing protein n=1 Tax=Neolewinella persica TaxID=70998 RepID=UPI00035D36AB|nr:carboxypeptidase-like regulatory domain-containing protein [Neolewinella persica]
MRFTNAILLFFLFNIGVIGSLTGQYTVRGVVIDANTGALLPSVNVFLQGNQSRGVLTNEKGEYKIVLSAEELKDQLVFSLLSYQTHKEPLWRLDTANLYFNLQMETSFISLNEVVVISDLGLKQLVKKCLDNVPNIYGQEDYLLKAYSRVYDIDSDTFSRQIEARLNIRDTNWPRPRPKKGEFFKTRPKIKIEQFRMPSYKGSSLRDRWEVLNGQYVLNSGYDGWVNKLRSPGGFRSALRGKQLLEAMTFRNRGEYLDGKDTLVKVHYRLSDEEVEAANIAPESVEHWYSGELLVNKTDLAFVRITEGKLREDNTEEFYRDALYQKVDGRYYVKRLKEIMSFDYNYNTATYYTNRLLHVTEVITNTKAIKAAFKGKSLDYTLDLKDVRVRYDVDYWADNSMLQDIPAPDMMQAALEQMQELRSQKKNNK